ncbi:hypothetical protein HanIR_Chr11g0556351 [Helianthus annuus]|nr:hypothetical protein HanIR_Chr11g0556351 [Helianthus annuus]
MGSIKIQSKTELYRFVRLVMLLAGLACVIDEVKVLGLRRIKNCVKPFSLDETAWKSFNFSDA